MTRKPFLSVHRLAVLAPIWVIALMFGLGFVAGYALEAFAPTGEPRAVMLAPAVIAFGALFLASRCPRCGALASTHNGRLFGWSTPFFAHEECPGCGLDLDAVTPWGQGIVRERREWVESLPPIRKAWVKLGLGRMLLTRLFVVVALGWAVTNLGPMLDAVVSVATKPFHT